jgi:hypothetical protein
MIRLLHIPERHCVLLHAVPQCHKRTGFNLYDDIDKAEASARLLLEYQDAREKWLYKLGITKDTHLYSSEKWKPRNDATVGRRIMDR